MRELNFEPKLADALRESSIQCPNAQKTPRERVQYLSMLFQGLKITIMIVGKEIENKSSVLYKKSQDA